MNIAGIDRSPVMIHYGARKYLPDMIKPVKNELWVKPKGGGLWTSPIDSIWGWKDWNKSEQYMECDEKISFKIQLKEDCKVFVIDCLDDLLSAPLIHDSCSQNKYIDFEKVAQSYDCIWLTEQGQRKTRFSRPVNLYGWDCETVLILNNKCCSPYQ